MKVAIIGGTHGNEFVGIEVMEAFKDKRSSDFLHDYHCFLGNPEAYKLKKRFVDSDLNRSFGVNGVSFGYENLRSKELQESINGKFDFIIDIHTTTSNMGLTVVLSRDDETSRRGAAYLQDAFPSIRLIKSKTMNEFCPYTCAIAPGITIEMGPVANNVVKAELVLSAYNMVSKLLTQDFAEVPKLVGREFYQTTYDLLYPAGGRWMVHPSIENSAFTLIRPGDPIFINIAGETLPFEGDEEAFPFFINEAAYRADGIAMSLSKKMTDW